MTMADNSAPKKISGDQAIRWPEIILVPLTALVLWFGILALEGFAGGFSAMKLGHSPDDIRKYLAHTMNTPFVFMMVLAAFYFAFLIMLGFALRGRRDSLVATYSHEISREQIIMAVVIGILLAIDVDFGLDYLAAHHLVSFHTPTNMERMLTPLTYSEMLLSLPALALLAPYVEELFFRGFMLSWLKQSLPVPAAVLLSAAIFSFCHGHLFNFPGAEGWVLSGVIVLLGVINATWALLSRSLWPPLAVHAAYNGTLLAMGFPFGS